MRTHIRLYGVFSVMLIFVLTACYQSASSADFVQVQGLDRSTETPLPLPSTTSGPAVVVTQEVEIEVTTIVEVIITATPEPTDTPSPFSPTPAEVAMAQPPFTESELEVFTESELEAFAQQGEPFLEDEGIVGFQEQELEFEQEVPTLDPLFATATQFVLEATYEVETLTATALGPALELPTLTPTEDIFALETSTPFPTPTQPVTFGGDCVHEVRAGENLFRLSLLYGVTVNEIAVASGIQNIQLIVIGQRLTIPNCGTTGVRPPATTIPPGEGGVGTSSVPPASGTRHIVQQGETLFQIALRYGVTVNDIVALNPSITNPNLIVMTTEIVIPAN